MEGKFNVGASDRLEGVGKTTKSPESQTGYLSKTSQSPGAMHELRVGERSGGIEANPARACRENSKVYTQSSELLADTEPFTKQA